MNLSDVSFEQLIGLAAVILLLIGIYNTVMTAIKNHIEAKRRHNAPVDALTAQVESHSKMLDKDKRRLDEDDKRFEDNDKRFEEMQTEMSMMLRGVRALLSHEINGNSIEKLQESYNNIDDYLINKGGK